jgi:hypothetical protein
MPRFGCRSFRARIHSHLRYLTSTIKAYVVGSMIARAATMATTDCNPPMIVGTVLLMTGATLLQHSFSPS